MILLVRARAASRSVSLAVLAFFCLWTSTALADKDDVFNVVLGTSYQHTNNLFKLDTGQQPAGPGAERWDNILRNNLTFKVNKQYSLQTFQVNFDHVENKYQNAQYLDFNADNYKAAWLWSITPSLKGNLSTDRTVELVPFLDFRNTNSQNIRTKKTQIFDFDWSPHNKWHLLGGYTKLDVVNSQTFLEETSFKFDSIEGGVKYSFPSASFIAFKVRHRQGENQETNFARVVGKEFTEDEEEFTAGWILTGKSKMASNFGHNRRNDDTFSIRDFSRYFGGINYAWDITSKLNLSIDLSRKLAAFLDTTSSYTEYDALTIRPTWAATSKITVSANASIGKRSFKGDGPIAASEEREDDMLNYGLGVSWAPRSTIRVGINLQHDARDSNFVNRDYSANTASISGQLTF